MKNKEKVMPSLVEVYPYNLAYDIFGGDTYKVEAEERALEISIKGIESALLIRLTEKEREVLKYRYKDKFTLSQIGGIYGVTGSYVRDIQMTGLRKLRHPSVLRIMRAYSYEEMREVYKDFSILQAENKKLKQVIGMLSEKDMEELEEMAKAIYVGEISVYELDFTARTCNSLRRKGINTLGEITELTLEELQSIRNLGVKSVEEVLNLLDKYDLKLKISNNK